MIRKLYRFKDKDSVEYTIGDIPVERLFTVQDIYNMRENPDRCLSVFGYTGSEILALIRKSEEHKMTREEAIQKTHNMGKNLDLLNMLEALGLLKFEEEPSQIIKQWLSENFIHGEFMLSADKIVNELMKAGYKIVKA